MQTLENRRVAPLVLGVSFVAALLVAMLLSYSHASAASLNKTFVRFDRMKINSATTGTVCASPTTVASTEGKVVVTFPAGYTVSTTLANWTVTTTNLAWPTVSGFTTAAWPGIGTATAAAGQVVTFPSSDLTSATTLYCFNWSSNTAVSNPSAASPSLGGSVATQTSAAAAIDSGTYSSAVVSDDQIAVTASVSQTFSFALSGNTDSLGSLTTAGVSSSTTPRTATVNTNAKNGWNVWAADANAGLNSASAAKTIASSTPGAASPTTLTAGTEGYNLGVTQAQTGGSGTVSVASGFVGSASTGGGLDTALRSLASSNGTANNAVLTLTNNAAINATTPAASDYADTITVVGAGLF